MAWRFSELSALHALGDTDEQARAKFVKRVSTALEESRGDIKRAAVILDVGRSTLDRWLTEHGDDGPLMKKLIEERNKAKARRAGVR